MQKNQLSVLKGVAFLVLSLGFAGASFAAAPATLFHETFQAPLSADLWKISPKDAVVSAGEGVLTIQANTAAASENSYAVTFIRSATPQPRLNFAKNTVLITLADLDLKGDAADDRRIFHVLITSDKAGDDASNKIQLRIAGNGNVILAGTNKDATTPLFATYYGTAAFPIKTIKLTLSPTGGKLSIQDAGGLNESELAFEAPPAAWESSAPYIRLQTQRNPGSGDTLVTLGGFSVESVPAVVASPK